MGDLGIEDLPGELPRLLQDHPAVFGVGVVAEIRALVDEAPPGRVHHDGEGVAVLLELIADREVAELWRVPFPAHRVAARPVAIGHRADIERHADPVAGIEPCPAHLGELPAGAEIARAPFVITLESAGGEHHRFRPDLLDAALALHLHPAHRHPVEDEVGRAVAVTDLDAPRGGDLVQRIDQPGTAAPGLDREPAPELELSVDLEGLSAPDRREAHALSAHPEQGVARPRDQQLDHVRIGAVLGDPGHVVVELVLGVGAEIGVGDLLVGEVRHQPLEVVDPVIDHPHGARGEARIAPRFVLVRAFEHQHPGAVLLRRQRRAQRRVAGAHDDDIELGIAHSTVSKPHPPADSTLSIVARGRDRRRVRNARRRIRKAIRPPGRPSSVPVRSSCRSRCGRAPARCRRGSAPGCGRGRGRGAPAAPP